MTKAYLGLGTNIGNRLNFLNEACNLIEKIPDTTITKKSKIYETKAWGYTDQADFLNLCLEINTNLSPMELLKNCQNIELKLKRERVLRWGPRTIDIDILFYDDIISNDEILTIPHPRIHKRAFVMIPLMDLNENLVINKNTIKEHLQNITQEEMDEVKEFIGND
jgi:2-amino-4-hydroxy-6-hydroxymethyldihydropteridine diphosphokinase